MGPVVVWAEHGVHRGGALVRPGVHGPRRALLPRGHPPDPHRVRELCGPGRDPRHLQADAQPHGGRQPRGRRSRALPDRPGDLRGGGGSAQARAHGRRHLRLVQAPQLHVRRQPAPPAHAGVLVLRNALDHRLAPGPTHAGVPVHRRRLPRLCRLVARREPREQRRRLPISGSARAGVEQGLPVLGPPAGPALQDLRQRLQDPRGRPRPLRRHRALPDQRGLPRVLQRVPPRAVRHGLPQAHRRPARGRREHPLLRAVPRGQLHQRRRCGRVRPLPGRRPARGARHAGHAGRSHRAVPENPGRRQAHPQPVHGLRPGHPAARPLVAHDPARRLGLRARRLGPLQLRAVRGAARSPPAGPPQPSFFPFLCSCSIRFLFTCFFSRRLARRGTSGCASTGTRSSPSSPGWAGRPCWRATCACRSC